MKVSITVIRKTSNNFDIRSRLAIRIQVIANKMTTYSAITHTKELNIGVQEARVLIVLGRLGKVSANEICEFGKMDKGNVSRAIDRLVKKECNRKVKPRGQKECQFKDNSWRNEIILPYKNIVRY